MRSSTSSFVSGSVLVGTLLLAPRAAAQCHEWDTGFGAAANSAVNAIATYDDGTGEALYAGGDFTLVGGVAAASIAKWDGTSWSALGGGVDGSVYVLGVFDLGGGPALYAGGTFSNAGGAPASRIARWDGTNWSALGSPVDGTTGFVSAFCLHDDGSGPALYVGGFFTSAGGISAKRIARWDGTQWSALGGVADELNERVSALCVFDDGGGPKLYAGGVFTSIGGTPIARIARWNGTSWSALGSSPSSYVHTLAVFDDGGGPDLYLGGDFFNIGALTARYIARWNGTNYSTISGAGSGTDSDVLALAVYDDGAGNALYLGGSFTMAGGGAAPRMARWSGSSWSTVGVTSGGFNSTVRSFAVFDDGKDGDPDLYAAGNFTGVNATASLHIAEWHGCANLVPYCFGDGILAACPCANSGLAGRGCDNSAATGGAQLGSSGTLVPDTLVLTQQGELPTSLSIFLQGSSELAVPAVFGDGLRCAGGSLKRLYVKSASLGSVSAPSGGDASVSAQSAALGDPIAPGSSRQYQVYYRDPSPTHCPNPPGNTFNVGNALRVQW